MYIKYEDCGSIVIIHIPDGRQWTLGYALFDDESDNSIFLEVEYCDRVLIADPDKYCQGRPHLPAYQVGHLYEAVVNQAAAQLAADPQCRFLDLPAIETAVRKDCYEILWRQKGYIDPSDQML